MAHFPYCSYLSQNDFFWFLFVSNKMCLTHFSTAEEVMEAWNGQVSKKPSSDWQMYFNSNISREKEVTNNILGKQSEIGFNNQIDLLTRIILQILYIRHIWNGSWDSCLAYLYSRVKIDEKKTIF